MKLNIYSYAILYVHIINLSKMSEEILEITDNLKIDESIEKYEFHEYTPGKINLDSSGPITISLEAQDIFTHPSESFLLVEGNLLKVDGTTYADADQIALCNNGIMHMFEYIKYQLSGQEIENINYVGQATTMLGLLSYSNDFAT